MTLQLSRLRAFPIPSRHLTPGDHLHPHTQDQVTSLLTDLAQLLSDQGRSAPQVCGRTLTLNAEGTPIRVSLRLTMTGHVQWSADRRGVPCTLPSLLAALGVRERDALALMLRSESVALLARLDLAGRS